MFRFTCQTCSKKFMRSDHLAKHIKTHENKVKRNSGSKTPAKAIESNKKNVKEEQQSVITATDVVIKKEKEELSSCTINNNNDRSNCVINEEKKNQDHFLSPNYPNYNSPYSTTSAYSNFQTNMNLCSGPTTNHSNNSNNTFLPPTPPLLSESDAKNMFHTYNTSHPSHLHHNATTTMSPSPFSSSINNGNNSYNQPHSRVPLSPSTAYSSSASVNSTVPLSSLSSNTNSHILSPTSATSQNNYHHFNDTNLAFSGHHHHPHLVPNHQTKTPTLNYHQTLNNNSYYMTNITINQIGPLATSPSTTRPLNSTNTFGEALHLSR